MPNRRLARQITLAFTALGLALTLILGLGMVAALKSVETRMLDDTLQAELAYFKLTERADRSLQTFISRTTTIHVTRTGDDDSIPAYLSDLHVGSHEVVNDNHNYRVLVEQAGDIRYIVQFDDTDIRAREQQFVLLVWIIAFSTMVVAMAFGVVVARRVSAPLTRLAQEVVSLGTEPGQNIETHAYENDEIGFLAERLHHYHDQLAQLLVREKEFAGNVSHELRTPVTNISLAAEVLATKSQLSDADRSCIHRIQRASHEMTELVDTFLVLSKAENSASVVCDACDVNAITKDVVEQQKVWLYEKPIEVVIEEAAELRVKAPVRVVSVLIANLVRNAFRYTQRGNVTIRLLEDRLLVEDTGPGIDSEIQAGLFKPHARGESVDPDGFGLGLSIVQRICERYGWHVAFENRGGHGSRFEVSF